MKRFSPSLLVAVVLSASVGAALLRDVPRSEPNQVVELAPGVYFRHGDLDGQGHCNNGIVVFRDFVLVIDGNFPSGAEACLADVKKITDKPVRFVFNTHHHGDHAYGNPVWVRNGVIPVAHQNVVSEMARLEPARWKDAKRPDVEALGLPGPQPPILTYPDRMVFDDGTQRVELLHFGTAHTRGDGFAYLPKHKILFTGDAVVNGPYNYVGDGDTGSWIQVVGHLEQIDVELVAPGHGPVAGRELLARQKLFFTELRSAVAKSIAGGASIEEAVKSVKLPDAVAAHVGSFFADQVRKAYREMVGLEMPFELLEIGLEEGPSPQKGDPGWSPPRKVVLADRQDLLESLRVVAPGVEIVAPSRDALMNAIADADAIIGRLDASLFKAAKNLRWFHSISAGVNQYVGAGTDSPGIPGFADSPVVLTNGRRTYGPNIGDQVFALLLAFTRGVRDAVEGKATAEGKELWARTDRKAVSHEIELRGRTMLIVGAGGIGSEVARRAQAFGMRVIATDAKLKSAPSGIDELHAPSKLAELLPRADVLVLACPYTRETHHRIGAKEFGALKTGAYLINVARGAVVERGALAQALRSGRLAGAGLDVTDPEPLPDSDSLWGAPNLIITPHNAGRSDGSRRRIQLLLRENLRRFSSGEPLLNVVDKKAGY